MKQLFLCIIICGVFSFSVFSDTDFDQALQVAEHGYKEFLSKCLDKQAIKQWGLSKKDNLVNAELGTPFRLMVIKPDLITGFKSNSTVNSVLEFSNTWFFPVKFNGTIKMFMTLHKYPRRSTYEIGSVGHVHLAQQIKQVLQTWPRNKGYSPLLCVNCQTQTYAFSIPQVSDNNLTLIDPAKPDSMYRGLSSLNTSMLLLKNRLSECTVKGGE